MILALELSQKKLCKSVDCYDPAKSPWMIHDRTCVDCTGWTMLWRLCSDHLFHLNVANLKIYAPACAFRGRQAFLDQFCNS